MRFSAFLVGAVGANQDAIGQQAQLEAGADLLLHLSSVNAVDADHDGFLSGAELADFAGARSALARLRMREDHFGSFDASGATHALDTDGDGFVSAAELQAAQALTSPAEAAGGSATHGRSGGVSEEARARLHAGFHAADEDGDGKLGAREYHLLLHPEFHAAAAATAAMSESAAAALLGAADADADEALSFAEYWNHVSATAAGRDGDSGVAATEDAHFALFGRHATAGQLSHEGLAALQAEHAAAEDAGGAMAGSGRRAAEALLAELDANEDGRLSPKELFTPEEQARFASFVRGLDAAERALLGTVGGAPQHSDPSVAAALRHGEL
jgi:hypothetical protein